VKGEGNPTEEAKEKLWSQKGGVGGGSLLISHAISLAFLHSDYLKTTHKKKVSQQQHFSIDK
jgi:hypothetical protein